MEDNFIKAILKAKKYGGKIFKELEWAKWIAEGGEHPEEFLDFTLVKWAELVGEN